MRMIEFLEDATPDIDDLVVKSYCLFPENEEERERHIIHGQARLALNVLNGYYSDNDMPHLEKETYQKMYDAGEYFGRMQKDMIEIYEQGILCGAIVSELIDQYTVYLNIGGEIPSINSVYHGLIGAYHHETSHHNLSLNLKDCKDAWKLFKNVGHFWFAALRVSH